MPSSQQTSSALQSPQDKYVKMWEGNLLDRDKGSLSLSPKWKVIGVHHLLRRLQRIGLQHCKQFDSYLRTTCITSNESAQVSWTTARKETLCSHPIAVTDIAAFHF